MAFIDRVKFDGLASRDWLIYKHPSEKLSWGTQLIVGEGQVALFVKHGQICDVFTPGTYTLSTENLPILRELINLPFGGKTPFTAEIFYINTVTKLDMMWGTSDPIQLVDPKYYTRLRVRAFGQFGMKISDHVLFMRELIGAMNPSDIVKFQKVTDYFKGILVTKVKSIISDLMINQKISALEITPMLEEISEKVEAQLEADFAEFGLSLTKFFIKSINFPDEDFEQINKILENRAEFEIMGDNRYATMRSFDVYEGAATNQGGVAGAFVAGGIGLGAAGAIAKNAQSDLQSAAGGKYCPACHAQNNADAAFCSGCGKSLTPQEEGACPFCGKSVASGSKFCPSCGREISEKTCAKCGAKLTRDARFCNQCGNAVEDTTPVCGGCGAKLTPGAKFCVECGKQVNGDA
ncbi:MAG: SPFH domain-containing protein [Clostridiales bacterium]|jgi:membrane protease subunit (stomatin/prohibitin family)|nr:SPFH domain-containing protein [Clostridiales bacterium]